MIYKLCLCAICLCVVLVVYDQFVREDSPVVVVSPQQKAVMKTGDMIFSSGDSFKSSIVKLFTPGSKRETSFSHCGLIVRQQGQPYVVHMSIDSDKIVKESLDEFVTNNSVIAFDLLAMSEMVDSSRFVGEIDRLLALKVPFDHAYDASDSQRLYCTEMIAWLYYSQSNVNLYLHDDRGDIIYPDELYDKVKHTLTH